MTSSTQPGHISLLGKLGLLLLSIFVLFGSLVFYVQTRHGFRHLIIPLATHFTGARIEAQEGRLSLFGSIAVTGFAYEDSASGVSFATQQMTLSVSPLSFLRGQVPRVHELDLKQTNLHILSQPGSSDATLHQPTMRSFETLPLIPVAVKRARFEDVAVTLEQEDRKFTGQATGTVDNLGPGRTGTITIQANILLQRDGLQDLSTTLNLNLSMNVGSSGMPLTWQGSNEILIQKGNELFNSVDPVVVSFIQTFTGDFDSAAQSLQVVSNIMIRSGDRKPLGTAELTVAMNGARHPAVIDASLRISGITGDTLRPWLDRDAPVDVHAGQFAASVETQFEGLRTSVRGTITGTGIQFQSGDEVASPPVDLVLQHVGSFDQATQTVAIETLELTISDNTKTLLAGTLDRPVSFQLDQREEEPPSANRDARPAIWSIQLTSWKMRELRPWLALLVDTPLQEIAAATVDGNLAISMYEEGAIIDVVGRLEGTGIVLRETESDGAVRTGPLRIVADWKSRLTGLQWLKLEQVILNVSLKEKQVALLHASGTWQITDGTKLTAVAGKIHFTRFPGATLSPLFRRWSPAWVRKGQIDGQAEVVVDTGHARWQIALYGQKMRLRLPDTTVDAPSVDLSIQQRGAFDRTTHHLWLDQLDIQLIERQRPVVAVSLDQPLSLNLASDPKEDDAQTKKSSEPITLKLKVNHLRMNKLRPWLALARSHALESVQGGSLAADIQVQLQGMDVVTIAGHLDLQEVMFERGKKLASAPVTLDTHVQASVVGRSRLIVDSWAVRALDRGKQLAKARLTGLADSAGATDLQMHLGTDDLSTLLDRLGLLTVRQQGLISGGNMTGDVRLATTGPKQPITVKTALKSSALHMQLDKTHRLTRSLSLSADVTVDAARTVADLQHAEIRVESAGVKAGTLTANGRWRLAPRGEEATLPGTVSVTIQGWDSGPLVDFFHLFPGRIPGPLPLTAQVTFAQKADSTSWWIRGKETVGPIRVAMHDRDPEPATVYLEHDVALNGDEIQFASLSLSTERPSERPDRVAMNGNIKLGSKPRLKLSGSLNALNIDWYVSLHTPSGESPSANKASRAEADEARLAIPLDLDLDLAIGSVIYRNLEIGQGKLVAKGDGKTVRARLEPTGLADGSVQGMVTVSVSRGQPEVSWDVRGAALDLGVLTMAPLDRPKPRVTGRAQFTTSGTGRGEGPAFRQSLEGVVTLNVENGQFIESKLLDYLAKVTTIDDFRGLGFSTVHANLHITDGWVHLDQVRVDGPSVGLDIDGKVGLDGQLDAQVQPKIGPDLSDHVPIPCLDQLAESVDDFTVLPVAVTVEGTVEHPVFGAEVAASSLLTKQAGAVVGTIADFLTACRGGEAAQEAVEDVVEAITDVAEDLVGDLLGTTTTPESADTSKK